MITIAIVLIVTTITALFVLLATAPMVVEAAERPAAPRPVARIEPRPESSRPETRAA